MLGAASRCSAHCTCLLELAGMSSMRVAVDILTARLEEMVQRPHPTPTQEEELLQVESLLQPMVSAIHSPLEPDIVAGAMNALTEAAALNLLPLSVVHSIVLPSLHTPPSDSPEGYPLGADATSELEAIQAENSALKSSLQAIVCSLEDKGSSSSLPPPSSTSTQRPVVETQVREAESLVASLRSPPRHSSPTPTHSQPSPPRSTGSPLRRNSPDPGLPEIQPPLPSPGYGYPVGFEPPSDPYLAHRVPSKTEAVLSRPIDPALRAARAEAGRKRPAIIFDERALALQVERQKRNRDREAAAEAAAARALWNPDTRSRFPRSSFTFSSPQRTALSPFQQVLVSSTRSRIIPPAYTTSPAPQPPPRHPQGPPIFVRKPVRF